MIHIFFLLENRQYLILGKRRNDEQRNGLTIDERSVMLEWRSDWTSRMRRLTKKASKCYERY